MTRSDRTGPSSSFLLREVRRQRNVWAAWAHVRRTALYSNSRETRQAASLIEEEPTKALGRIVRRLRQRSYEFEPQKGVVKASKPGKKPRPLVIAPVENRIVQRAILQVLQSEEPKVRAMLGAIPDTLRSPGSVGGIPKVGALNAVDAITAAQAEGMTHYLRSDIKSFFTRVPVPPLIEFVEEQTSDPGFAALLEAALQVELANAEQPDVKEWADLFPDGKVGVPQGSSLSAFCANVTLREFDRLLRTPETTAVRYIDDFVILGTSKEAVARAARRGRPELEKANLELWLPEEDPDKAALGTISKGFDFLSYRFNDEGVLVSRKAQVRLMEQVRSDLAAARKAIRQGATKTRKSAPGYVQTLARLDRQLWGWGNSFRGVTKRQQFFQLDSKIEEEVRAFVGWYERTMKKTEMTEARRALGVALLADVPPRKTTTS